MRLSEGHRRLLVRRLTMGCHSSRGGWSGSSRGQWRQQLALATVSLQLGQGSACARRGTLTACVQQRLCCLLSALPPPKTHWAVQSGLLRFLWDAGWQRIGRLGLHAMASLL